MKNSQSTFVTKLVSLPVRAIAITGIILAFHYNTQAVQLTRDNYPLIVPFVCKANDITSTQITVNGVTTSLETECREHDIFPWHFEAFDAPLVPYTNETIAVALNKIGELHQQFLTTYGQLLKSGFKPQYEALEGLRNQMFQILKGFSQAKKVLAEGGSIDDEFFQQLEQTAAETTNRLYHILDICPGAPEHMAIERQDGTE
ncbi:MAG: hypothetical protein LBJ77_02825 [Holosporales bacterium]|jgi:hypothetical protein|nr:hypothetical protein [Holosporales bacterium]